MVVVVVVLMMMMMIRSGSRFRDDCGVWERYAAGNSTLEKRGKGGMCMERLVV